MKRCPVCGTEYPVSQGFCPMDGNPLVEAAVVRAAAPEWHAPARPVSSTATEGASIPPLTQTTASEQASLGSRRPELVFRPNHGTGSTAHGPKARASVPVAPAASGAAELRQASAPEAVPAANLPEGAFFPTGGLSRPRAERSTPEEMLVGRVLDQRYRIEAPIGYGSMGVVFKARHVIIDKPLAIKILRSDQASQPDVIKRFLLEAQLASRIKHANIVDISDYGQIPGGTGYYVMEFLTGETLAHKVDRVGRLDPILAVEVGQQILSGLQAAHAGKIIHRDLKSENIFLCEAPEAAPQVKILDFGIARIRDNKTRLTAHGALIGTPAYMSPEQAQGEDADERSDLYSFGVILFEMLTGRVPFKQSTVAKILSAQIYDTPPTLREAEAATPDLPNLERFVRILLAKNRSERPQSATEAVSLLKAAAELDVSTALNHRRRATMTIGSWAVAEGNPKAPHETASPSVTNRGSEIEGNIDVEIVVETPAGHIERRPSVIVQHDAGVERIAPPVRPQTSQISPRGPMSGGSPESRAGGPPMLLIIAAAASIGAAITVTLYKQYYRKAVPAAIPAPMQGPAAPMMIKLTFESDPAGAAVLRDAAELIGTAPFVFEVAPQSPTRRYVFRLAGYEDAITHVTPGKTNERVRVHMRPLVPPPLAPAPPTPAPAPVPDPTPPTSAPTTPAPTDAKAAQTSPTKPKPMRTPVPPPKGPEAPENPPLPQSDDDNDMGELKNPFSTK